MRGSSIISADLLYSEKLNLCAGDVRDLYTRLILVGDDYGRGRGDAASIRSSCFPNRVPQFSLGRIAGWLTALQERGLITLYSDDTGDFFEIVGSRQRTYGRPSKFPESPGGSR